MRKIKLFDFLEQSNIIGRPYNTSGLRARLLRSATLSLSIHKENSSTKMGILSIQIINFKIKFSNQYIKSAQRSSI